MPTSAEFASAKLNPAEQQLQILSEPLHAQPISYLQSAVDSDTDSDKDRIPLSHITRAATTKGKGRGKKSQATKKKIEEQYLHIEKLLPEHFKETWQVAKPEFQRAYYHLKMLGGVHPKIGLMRFLKQGFVEIWNEIRKITEEKKIIIIAPTAPAPPPPSESDNGMIDWQAIYNEIN